MPVTLPAVNSYEGGVDETAITLANSGGASGTAFTFIDQGGTGSSIVFDNARAAHGSFSARYTQGATPTSKAVSWDLTSTATALWGRFYYYATANPGTSFHLLTFWSGTADVGYVDINGDGTFSIVDSTFANRGTSTAALTLNAWNRFEWRYTTTVVEARLYSGDSTIAVFDLTSSAATFGTQVAAVAHSMNAAAANHVFWLDDLQVNATGFPGPAIALQQARPTSDIQATGWAPTPASPTTLFDKLDEAAADDTDYVRGVAT